jgi:hypothetical protein
MDVVRLANDREYWNDMAPEGALWYAPDTELWYEAWFRVNDADVEYLLQEEWLYEAANWTRMQDISALGQQNLIRRPAEFEDENDD